MEDDIFQGNFIVKNGNKTEIYAYGQKANRQIAAVDDVLMNSVSKGVIVTGTSPDPSIPAADTLTKYGALTGVSHSGAAFLTGCFDYGGQKCVLCCQQLHHAKRHRHAAVREIGQRQPGNRRGQKPLFPAAR